MGFVGIYKLMLMNLASLLYPSLCLPLTVQKNHKWVRDVYILALGLICVSWSVQPDVLFVTMRP